jgi:hypothetical protein
MASNAVVAIPAFRQVHQRAIMVHLVQLLGILGA